MSTLFGTNRCFLQIQIQIGGALFYFIQFSFCFVGKLAGNMVETEDMHWDWDPVGRKSKETSREAFIFMQA